jgi:H+/Cl- antiporter ClcA
MHADHRAFTALSGDNIALGWVMWTAFTMTFALIIVAFTVNFEPHAAGSGVPEIKTILSGIALEDYLHWRNLVTKVIGMAVAAGSGVIIGKPLSHAGAVLASLLLRIPLFHRMNSVCQSVSARAPVVA